MHITLINPNNVTQKGDFFGTGIPYMPITLAYLASCLRNSHEISVIDAFGENPFKKRTKAGFIIQGLTTKDIIKRINPKTGLIFLYAGHIVEHIVIKEIIKEIKRKLNTKIAIIENSQAVTAYSLVKAKEEFFSSGADIIIYGEPEKTAIELIKCIKKNKEPSNVKGIIYKKNNKIKTNKKQEYIKDLDKLPFPAWDLFPIKNYWKLHYAHAPMKQNYLPLLTSRGCPFQCEFCIIPTTNEKRWRFRTARNVVDEITEFSKRYNIKEFHIEDLNPTINKKRIKDICKLIIKKKLNIKTKFASGIKLETIDKETLSLLAKSGCNYLSFSPESGSKKMLELMKKPFNHNHGISMTKEMNRLGIKSQACFVLGFPGETSKDLKLTKDYIIRLTKAGVDEIALFIMTPIPGSKVYESWETKDLSKLTFSPVWRKEYKKLHNFRKKLYILFFIHKLLNHPLKTLKQPINIILKKFETKMEMTIYRRIRV
jgi:radical SAM superfamily enzyme YgiQ (UPF0313 family)